jgi:hypothetical protein
VLPLAGFCGLLLRRSQFQELSVTLLQQYSTRSQPKLNTYMRIRQVLYPNGQIHIAKVTGWMQQFLRLIMKKFIVFILVSILLIISAYLLFNELYSQKRILVLMLSLVGTIFCIYATHRFFKKYILQSKQAEPHS